MPDPWQFNTDRTHPGRWTITFSNPPINMFVPTTIVELGALMTDLEADPSVKVVVFQSANPDFFIAHLDVAKAAERPEVLALWRDFVLRLSSTPVVSIAKIRGRTRGIGNEFVLACDMRFASRQSALFGNPEIGVGLVPGGGALEWLPRLVGRSRALEIVLSGDDFDADIAERYGWVNRTLDDGDLDSFVDALVRRLASFDRETLAAAKSQINRFGTPPPPELNWARNLSVPSGYRQLHNPILPSTENIRGGMEHFSYHCATCHGNDGGGQTVFGKGLYPKPPDLRAAGTQNKSDGELYYTIENGVRLSGMPAFHGTHTVPQTWRLVLFIRHLPQITPEELREMNGWNSKMEADPAHF